MNIQDAIRLLREHVANPTEGLPEPLFYFVSRITPLVNVDLLIRDGNGRVLLAWRDDPLAGRGWHVPGGIVRFKETFEERVEKVAATEIGIPVAFDPQPIAMKQLIHPDREVRGHFISILYDCHLPGDFVPQNKGRTQHDAGYLQWHTGCPENLIRYHDMYRPYFDDAGAGGKNDNRAG